MKPVLTSRAVSIRFLGVLMICPKQVPISRGVVIKQNLNYKKKWHLLVYKMGQACIGMRKAKSMVLWREDVCIQEDLRTWKDTLWISIWVQSWSGTERSVKSMILVSVLFPKILQLILLFLSFQQKSFFFNSLICPWVCGGQRKHFNHVATWNEICVHFYELYVHLIFYVHLFKWTLCWRKALSIKESLHDLWFFLA